MSVVNGVAGFINRAIHSVSTPKNASNLFGMSQIKGMGGRSSMAWDNAASIRQMNQKDAAQWDATMGLDKGTTPYGNIGAAGAFSKDMGSMAWDYFSAKGYQGNRWGAGAARLGLAGGAMAAADFVNPFGFGWND